MLHMLCGGGSICLLVEVNPVQVSPSGALVVKIKKVWLRFLFLFGCCHGDGSGGGEEGSQQSPRLVRCSLSMAIGLNYGALRRLPVPMSPNPLAEWRLYEEFLHAHDWQVWRQSIFVKTSTSSTSSRSWRWRCGGIVAPSGFVPGCEALVL